MKIEVIQTGIKQCNLAVSVMTPSVKEIGLKRLHANQTLKGLGLFLFHLGGGGVVYLMGLF